MAQVTTSTIKKLSLNDSVVTDVIPTTVKVEKVQKENTGIKIAKITVNGETTSIFSPQHQDISHKLDKVEFSAVSANFLVEDDLAPYAKIEQIPTNVSELVNDKNYAISSDVNSRIVEDLEPYAKIEDLPTIATDKTPGLIMLGFEEQPVSKNYPVQIEGGKAFVHVPWTGGSTGDVAVDDITIKKKNDGTNRIYVNQVPFDSIVLNEPITFSGNYTLGIKKQKVTDTWTAPAGMTLLQLFKEMFTGEQPTVYNYFIIHCNDLSEIDKITDDNIKDNAVSYYLEEPDKLEVECTSKYIAMYIPKTSARQGINIGEVGLGLDEEYTARSVNYKCFIAGAKRAFNLPVNTPITYL